MRRSSTQFNKFLMIAKSAFVMVMSGSNPLRRTIFAIFVLPYPPPPPLNISKSVNAICEPSCNANPTAGSKFLSSSLVPMTTDWPSVKLESLL